MFIKSKKIIISALFLLFLIITGFFIFKNPRLNTLSNDTIQKSILKMQNSLSIYEKEKFINAIDIILSSKIDLQNVISGGLQSEQYAVKVLQGYDGKNAHEIIEIADGILEERKKEQKKQAFVEIKEINDKIEHSKEAKKLLSKIEIIKSKFYKTFDTYITKPVIDISIKNNTEHVIAYICFEGLLASPNRVVPWLKDNFCYDIKGGLESKESAYWSLLPNIFSDWGETDAPEDAILTVKVISIEDENKKELANLENVDDVLLKRLKELETFIKEN